MVLELEATQAQLQRVLQSKAFRTSEVHRNLLSYLAEKSLAGDSDSLKEYAIGLDVFGKPASYDPRQESTVRMHVGRLRQKLAEYYRTEGVDDAIVIDLPKGGFRVTFEPRMGTDTVAPDAAPFAARTYRREAVLAVGLLVALALAGYFGVRLWQANRATTGAVATISPELREFWGPLLSSKRPLMLCLATPTPSAAGVGAASGAFLLGQFLSQHRNVLLTPCEQLSAPEMAMGNVVFLGSAAGNRQLTIHVEQQVVLEPSGVRILKPLPGEEGFLADRPPADPLDVDESYALISHVPGLYNDGEILYISANRAGGVSGGVRAFTDTAFARALLPKMKRAGVLPKYYQIVVKVRSMDELPVDFSYVLHRELRPSSSAKR